MESRLEESRKALSGRPATVAGVVLLTFFIVFGDVGPAAATELVTYLPGVARADGLAGTRFESRVEVTNLGPAASRFHVDLIPSAGFDAPLSRELWLASGETRVVDDVIGRWFDLDAVAGTIVIRGGRPFVVTGRTSNVGNAAGRFGLGLEPVQGQDLLHRGDVAHGISGRISRDLETGWRTNLGLVATRPDSRGRVILRDGVGRMLSGFPFQFSRPESWQQGLATLLPSHEGDVRVTVEVDAGEMTAWLSVVDNRSGDAVLETLTAEPDRPSDLVINGAASAAGIGGSLWSTELRLFAPGDEATRVRIEMPAWDARLDLDLGPGETRVLERLLGVHLGLPEGSAGAVRVMSDRPVVVTGKTVNRGSGAGTFAARLQPVRRDAGLLGPGRIWQLGGLNDDSSRARCNVGLVGGRDGALLTLVLRDSAGEVQGERSVRVEAWQWLQQTLRDWFGVVAVEEGSRLEIVVGSGQVDVYASVIDQGTGDPVVLRPFAGPVPGEGLAGRVLTGYQGWFGTPQDGSPVARWQHWFRRQDPVAEDLVVDAWPDLSEFAPQELEATEMSNAAGEPVAAFSSGRKQTVERHLRWMKDHGIDGPVLQRFAVDLRDAELVGFRDDVAIAVRSAAESHGRVFFVMYDLTRHPGDGLVEEVLDDWRHVVDRLLLTSSDRYLRDHGLPLVGIWGLGFPDRPLQPTAASELLRGFREAVPARYRARVVAGIPAGWRELSAWQDVWQQVDVLSPWMVGQMRDVESVEDWYRQQVAADLHRARELGADYLPVLFPGFSWHNLTGAPLNEIPRQGGVFFWRQVQAALQAGNPALYVAMFDEVDEGTAIFPLASKSELPLGTDLVAVDEGGPVPADWYLRLAGAAGRRLRSGGDAGPMPADP